MASPTWSNCIKSRMQCLQTANDFLGNIEGAHRVHGWSVPLRVTNTTIGPMATLSSIGEPNPYVHDAVSMSLARLGFWELREPIAELAAAARLSSKRLRALQDGGGDVLDVGAQIGFYSLAFAAAGFRVLSIEPMTQNVLALEASRCLNPALSDRITVLPIAVVGPAQLSRASCAVLSPFHANDHGDGVVECTNKSGSSCDRRHNGQTIKANFTYFFHYRRFCLQLIKPLQTLDSLLLDGPMLNKPTSLKVVKIDTSGTECDVLDGARRSLAGALRPALMLVNVGSGAKSREACVRRFATSNGFAMHPLPTVRSDVRSGARMTDNTHVVLVDDPLSYAEAR